MFANRQECVDQVLVLIQNERAGRGLDRANIVDACDSAAALFSRFSPREASDTLTGTGSSYNFLLTLLDPGWINGLSTLLYVEYAVGDQEPTLLDESEYRLWPVAGQPTHLRFLSTTPASAADNIRVGYTTTHILTDTTSTISDHEEKAFELVVAADALEIYAARYIHSTQASIDADSIDAGSQGRDALALARVLRARAGRILGVDLTGDATGAAGGGGRPTVRYADIDPNPGGYSSLVFRNRTQR